VSRSVSSTARCTASLEAHVAIRRVSRTGHVGDALEGGHDRQEDDANQSPSNGNRRETSIEKRLPPSREGLGPSDHVSRRRYRRKLWCDNQRLGESLASQNWRIRSQIETFRSEFPERPPFALVTDSLPALLQRASRKTGRQSPVGPSPASLSVRDGRNRSIVRSVGPFARDRHAGPDVAVARRVPTATVFAKAWRTSSGHPSRRSLGVCAAGNGAGASWRSERPFRDFR